MKLLLPGGYYLERSQTDEEPSWCLRLSGEWWRQVVWLADDDVRAFARSMWDSRMPGPAGPSWDELTDDQRRDIFGPDA